MKTILRTIVGILTFCSIWGLSFVYEHLRSIKWNEFSSDNSIIQIVLSGLFVLFLFYGFGKFVIEILSMNTPQHWESIEKEPRKSGTYLVIINYPKGNLITDIGYFEKEKYFRGEWRETGDKQVVAWANLPQPCDWEDVFEMNDRAKKRKIFD